MQTCKAENSLYFIAKANGNEVVVLCLLEQVNRMSNSGRLFTKKLPFFSIDIPPNRTIIRSLNANEY